MSSELTYSDGHAVTTHLLNLVSASSDIKDNGLKKQVQAADNNADVDVQTGISSSVSTAVTSTGLGGAVPAITRAAIGKRKGVWKYAKETTKKDIDPKTRAEILSIMNRIGPIPDDDDDEDIIVYCGPVIPGRPPDEEKPDPPPRPESFWSTVHSNTDHVQRLRNSNAEWVARLAAASQEANQANQAKLAKANAWLQGSKRDLEEAISRSRLDAHNLLATAGMKHKHESVADGSSEDISPPAKKPRAS